MIFVCLMVQDYENAKKEYELALKLDPKNKELQESYRWSFKFFDSSSYVLYLIVSNK